MSVTSWAKRAAGIVAAAALATGATAALASTPAQAAGDGKVTAKSSLTVRYAPTRQAMKVSTIRPGATVPLVCKIAGASIEGNRTWYQLPAGEGAQSWISGRYVKELRGSKIAWCGTTSKPAAIRTTAKLTVRHGPNTHDTSVGSLKKGTRTKAVCKLKAQSVGGNTLWYQLPGSNWVSARYVDNIGGSPTWCVGN
ncbi:SH3 domain-containing protein [Microlunatus soli]|uniref:SH3b domain-containing protein n=1 Tax=Microlunatus soli TaxID=630515 RepID=A0A1H1VSJ6_9ACTN|nr:hypothetical protein [Microlunatus soli]SDS87430.1 hypothetical protein SAMN04489812_3324 [Microlunatus soli]